MELIALIVTVVQDEHIEFGDFTAVAAFLTSVLLPVLETVAAGGIQDVGPQGDGAPAIPVQIESMTVVT